MVDRKIVQLALLQGGAVRRVELLRAGVTPKMMAHAVESSQIALFPRGVYAVAGTPNWWIDARRQGAELGCISAAVTRGLWVVSKPETWHVCAPNSRISGPFIRHRSRGRPSVLDVVLQCLRCLPEREAFAVAESSVVLRQLTLAQLRAATLGRINAKINAIVARINPASESILETVARYELESAGYQVQIQKYFPGLGRLDMLLDGVLGLELDGREHHSTETAFDEDRRRNNYYVVNGIPTLRIKYSTVFYHPEEFLQLVSSAMAKVMSQR